MASVTLPMASRVTQGLATGTEFLEETTLVNAVNNSEPRPAFARPGRLNRDEDIPAGERLRSRPPARLAAWLLYALAALVLLVTTVMTLSSGAPTCTGAARPGATGHHAQIGTCAPAKNLPVPGAR